MELGKDLGPSWYNSIKSQIKSPQDATKVFFKFLKRSIVKAIKSEGLPENIKYAVSIPASFESNQRKDLMDALAANDIQMKGTLFIDEPNAAFLGYINSGETDPIVLSGDYNPKVLVFDFGAGTCDISLLEITADHQGIHSNNISISQFSELGGNDIDRYIANNILLPQLLKASNLDGEDDYFTEKQKDVIVNQLMPHAENMKINMCRKNLNFLLSDPESMEAAIGAGGGVEYTPTDFSINTNHGTLTIDKFRMSLVEFIDVMDVFFKRPISVHFDCYTLKGHQKRYNSIQAAINTALIKAHASKNEVDYVIMIGGSSRNPFVQHRIKQIFSESTVMVPRDLQALVSQGTALHSILVNGVSIQAVRPIVGEPIMVITQTEPISVIKAGTEVPFSTKVEDAFTTGTKTYKEIEIPICVGSDKKMLYNLMLRRNNGESFPEYTSVTLIFDMDSDKILHIKAETLGQSWEAVCENPLDNIALTDGEAKVLKAKRASYISASSNNNKPTARALDELSRAYEDNNQYFMAAETLEDSIQYYPNQSLYNRIGVLYHNSGNYNKAIKFFKEALKVNADNSTVLSNLGYDLYLIGKYKEARPVLEQAIELKGDYAIAITVLAKIEDAEKNSERTQELYQRAFNIFKRLWESDNLDNCSKGWFKGVAEKLNNHNVTEQLSQELINHTMSRGYSLENTLFHTKKSEDI